MTSLTRFIPALLFMGGVSLFSACSPSAPTPTPPAVTTSAEPLILPTEVPATPVPVGNCPPLSPEHCATLAIPLNTVFTFDGRDGGLYDQSGRQVGFTLVDEPSQVTPGSSNQYAPGYRPELLEIRSGKLFIRTTSGIQFKESNDQTNALGVALPTADRLFILQTSLPNVPTPAGGFAQAGLWLGWLEEASNGERAGGAKDNYVKLVLISTKEGQWDVQMLQEVAGEVPTEKTEALSEVPSSVTFQLEVDPAERKITGRYCVGNGCAVASAPIFVVLEDVPEAWFVHTFEGVEAQLKTRLVGGIFTSQRNASVPLNFAFEQFEYYAP